MPYAADTDVPVERSKSQIEAMLRACGARGFASAWDDFGDRVEFLWNALRIRFHLPRAARANFMHDNAGRERKPSAVDRRLQQHDRQRWRALYLVVKAKLEATDAGISCIEDEFLSFIVDPTTDKTVGDVLVPRIKDGSQLALPPAKGGR